MIDYQWGSQAEVGFKLDDQLPFFFLYICSIVLFQTVDCTS